MTELSEHLERFIGALQTAFDELNAVASDHQPDADVLLERWYSHTRKWVKPFQVRGHSVPGNVDSPAFQPKWSDLVLSDTDDSTLHFQRYQFGDEDDVYVPMAFFLDPDGWESADKDAKVTRETWTKQRERYLEQMRVEALERKANELRAQGFEVKRP